MPLRPRGRQVAEEAGVAPMSGKHHVQALMREVGPALRLLEVSEFDERDAWTLVVDEDTVLLADYEDGHRRLVLSADVAEAPEAGRLALHELLLGYNNRWRETGGVRLALDGSGVVQLFEFPVAELDLTGLQAVIAGFADTLRAWREIVGSAAGPAAGEEPSFSPMLAGMIRG